MKEIEKNLWVRVRKYVRFLKIVPFVRMIAVCNNLAFGKVDEKSDIDLFIVAKSGRLFIVRAFITLILRLFGVRTYGNKTAGRFCLSFFVDDEFLDLEKIAIYQDIYLAYWLKSLKPILDDGVSKVLLEKNIWIKKYFDNEEDFEMNKEYLMENKSFVSKIFEWILSGRFGNFCENLLKRWQLKMVEKRGKTVGKEADWIINDHILKFHNIDRRKQYRDRWLEKYGENAKLRNDLFLTL
ncbi:MAG: hypothetical protein AAB953_01080 [Patescibacteria group bacterium]